MERKYLCGLVSIMCICCLTANASGDSPAKHTFSLVIREGFGSIPIGDLNTTLESINAAYDIVRNYYPERCVGEILPLPTSYKDWEVELQWAAWWGFSLGLAVSGPTHYSGKSFLTYTIVEYAGTQTENDTYESEVQVSAPVMLNLRRSFSIFQNVGLVISGGIGFYRARMNLTQIMHLRYPLDDISLTSFYTDVTGREIGYHCGLALEYKLNKKFSLLAESRWKFAKITTLSGNSCITHQAFDADGNLAFSDIITKEGILYHLIGTSLVLGVRHEKLVLEDLIPPWDGVDDPFDIRRAFLDLGGFVFKIGLRIRLF